MTTQETKGMPEKGSSQARLAARAAKRREDEVLDVAGMSSEDFRLAKIAEALFERRRLDELLRQNNERIAQERRAAFNKENV